MLCFYSDLESNRKLLGLFLQVEHDHIYVCENQTVFLSDGFFFLMLKERCNAAWLTNCQRRTNEMLLDRKGMKRCYKLYWDGNNSEKGNNYMMLCEHRNCII